MRRARLHRLELGEAVDCLLLQQPFDAGFRMEMQKHGKLGRRKFVDGDHTATLAKWQQQ